jgi:Trehalose utilisation
MMQFALRLLLLIALVVGAPARASAAVDRAPRSVIIVAATRSRGGGLHEHRATADLLANLLRQVRATPPVHPTVIDENGAAAPGALDRARSVVLLGDEGPAHLLNDPALRANIATLIARQGGLVLLHGSAVPPADLENDIRDWAGGVAYSEGSLMAVNWPAGFGRLPEHPVLKGLTPFTVDDRWLPGSRLSGTDGVIPLLQAEPPEYGHVAGEPDPLTMAWTYERPKGGRSFVYGGGHFFPTYRDENVRRVLTQAILWTADINADFAPKRSIAVTAAVR